MSCKGLGGFSAGCTGALSKRVLQPCFALEPVWEDLQKAGLAGTLFRIFGRWLGSSNAPSSALLLSPGGGATCRDWLPHV